MSKGQWYPVAITYVIGSIVLFLVLKRFATDQSSIIVIALLLTSSENFGPIPATCPNSALYKLGYQLRIHSAPIAAITLLKVKKYLPNSTRDLVQLCLLPRNSRHGNVVFFTEGSKQRVGYFIKNMWFIRIS